MLVAVWFTQRPLTTWTSGNPGLNFYVVQPVIWSAFAVLAWRLYRRLPDALPYSRTLARIGFLAGLFQASVFILTGLAVGFGDNPLAGELVNYPLNVLYFTTLAAGIELTRATVFHTWRRVNEPGAFVAVVVLFAVAAIPLGQLDLIIDVDTAFRVGVGRYVPALTLSAVLTSFTAGGGILVSAAYRWPLLAMLWTFPILPNHDWPVQALIDTALPLLALIVARTLYEGTAEFALRYPEEMVDETTPEPDRHWVRWLAIGLGATLIVLFVNGAFGVRPYLLSGISMEPSYEKGDVVIVREVPVELLEVNDVIRYQQSSFEFIHRIIEIRDEDGELVFVTKGDNVSRPDPPISADRVTGKAVFLLPKVGLPSLWIREAMASQ